MLTMRCNKKTVFSLFLLVVSVIESLIFKQLTLAVLSTIFFISQIISSRSRRWTASSEAVIIYISIFIFLLVILPYLGIRQNEASIQSILYSLLVVTSCASIYESNKSTSDGNYFYSLIGFIGSIFLLALLARSVQLNGSIYPWAMSGDSRNHLLIVRQTVSDGRVRIIDSYPAFGDVLTGIISGWRIDEEAAKLGQLGYEIRQFATTYVLYLLGIGFLSSRAVSRDIKKRILVVSIAAGLMSFVMLSQLWLENYLRWGFMSSGMVILISIALYNVITSSEIGIRSVIFYSFVSMLVVLTTFPIMVGAIVGIVLGPIVLRSLAFKSTLKGKVVLLFSVATPFIILNIFALYLPLQEFMKSKLNIPGTISSISPNYTICFVLAFAVMILVSRQSVITLAVSGLTLSLSTLLIDKYLDNLLTETYYLQKFRWLSLFIICIVFCSCIISMYIESDNLIRKASAIAFYLLAALLFTTPTLQKFSSKNYVRSMVQSWEYPTMQEAQTIVKVNARTPRAVFWQVSPDYLSTQIMNMWLMLGIEEAKNKSDVVLWTYQRDQFSMQTICEFAVDNRPITIWVQAPEVKKVVKPFCNYSTIGVRTLSQTENRKS